MTEKTWKDVTFDYLLEKRRTNRIIGLSFPEQDTHLGLEPSVLTVLPPGDNVEYSLRNIDFNNEDVTWYVCSVYIAGMEEFRAWAQRHDRSKIVVGGYHPTTFPEEFVDYAYKIVRGPCDDLFATLDQEGQIVKGVVNYKTLPRYDLYKAEWNQQVIPDKRPHEVCSSINTSQGCPFKCDFCCTPIMSPKLISKPLEQVEKETNMIRNLYHPYWLFIRDENFPLQKDWRERLQTIHNILPHVNIYLFASANLLNEEVVSVMRQNGVYMICLGLEDITQSYDKNRHLDDAVKLLKNAGIFTYLSFIVNPLKIIGQDTGKSFYDRLLARFYELAPEMVCGNFLMPFRGTKLWDEYYAFISPEDYKYYNSKTAFLIKNPIVREKMHFFMFHYQWQYYTSEFYNKQVRNFYQPDTLFNRFQELYKDFRWRYERLWNVRA